AHLRGLGRCGRSTRAGAHRQFRRLRPPLGQRGKRGEVAQGIGRSRGGRTTRIHALADRWCRPVRLMLTGGNVADCIAAETLLQRLPPDALVVTGDKGYDSTAVRDQVKALGACKAVLQLIMEADVDGLKGGLRLTRSVAPAGA
ncbi:hypothetical protein DR046_21865, partial [Jannaschia formosa]